MDAYFESPITDIENEKIIQFNPGNIDILSDMDFRPVKGKLFR